MDVSALVSIFTGVVTITGTILAVIKSSEKTRTEFEMRVKSQQHQIEEMKADIKEHNNYAHDIPVIKTEISFIKDMIGELKDEKISNK